MRKRNIRGEDVDIVVRIRISGRCRPEKASAVQRLIGFPSLDAKSDLKQKPLGVIQQMGGSFLELANSCYWLLAKRWTNVWCAIKPNLLQEYKPKKFPKEIPYCYTRKFNWLQISGVTPSIKYVHSMKYRRLLNGIIMLNRYLHCICGMHGMKFSIQSLQHNWK